MKDHATNFARALRQKQTDAEVKLWSRLRNKQIDGWKFKRQVPRGPYVIDFFCAEAGLVVEVDGSQHYDDRAEYDRKRTDYLEREGYQVIRFWNRDVLKNVESVIGAIYRELGEQPAPSPGTSRRTKTSCRMRRPLPEGRGKTEPGSDSCA